MHLVCAAEFEGPEKNGTVTALIPCCHFVLLRYEHFPCCGHKEFLSLGLEAVCGVRLRDMKGQEFCLLITQVTGQGYAKIEPK